MLKTLIKLLQLAFQKRLLRNTEAVSRAESLDEAHLAAVNTHRDVGETNSLEEGRAQQNSVLNRFIGVAGDSQ